MPQWGWAEKSGAEIYPWPHMWIHVKLYLNCVHSRFSSHLKSVFLNSRYIDTILSLDDMQKSHINNPKTSKARWDVQKSVHGVSGKARLPAMMKRFLSYTKSADQTIDQVVSDLRKLRNDIADVNASSAPTDILMATTLMAACKESEFDVVKVILGMSDHLTTELAIEKLRTVEATKDSVSFARGSGRKARDRGGQPWKRDLSQVKCYMCDEKGHLMRDCPMRGLARKNKDAQQSSHRCDI